MSWLLHSIASALGFSGTDNNNKQSPGVAEAVPKPKKKICCACPDTKRLRDECIVEHGESACSKWIDAHLKCLRSQGFNV